MRVGSKCPIERLIGLFIGLFIGLWIFIQRKEFIRSQDLAIGDKTILFDL